MQILKRNYSKCGENCIKPSGRRLGLFQANDDFECYAENYIKCFWGMCDHHKSLDDFTTANTSTRVITVQPLSDNDTKIFTLNNPAITRELALSK